MTDLGPYARYIISIPEMARLGFTGTLTSFEYRSNTSITYKPTLYAVEIDGKQLVDSGTDLSGLTQYPAIANTGCSVGTKQGFSITKFTTVQALLAVPPCSRFEQ